MAPLVETLKQEHEALVSVLDRVRTLGIGAPEAKALLFSAKTALLAHLAKENEQLYPALRRAAGKDPKLQRTLDLFAKDLEAVSGAALAFFGKYEGADAAKGIEFGQDLGRLFAALSQRIRKEEHILYAEYEKL